MKKKLLIGFAVLTLGLVAAFNMSLNAGKSNFSMLSLANIEALAQNESQYSCSASSTCFTWNGIAAGSVSCTGTTCERGYEYVECDGKKTSC